MKKKFFILGLLGLAFAFILSFSCNDGLEYNSIDQKALNLRSENNIPLLTVSQIDSIGILHNDVLDYFLDNYFTSSDTLLTQSEFIAKYFNIIKLKYPNIDTNFNKIILDNLPVNRDSFPLYLKQYADLIDVVLAYNNYLQISSGLEDLVTNVNGNRELTSIEKQNVLIMLSVAKHSAYYWLPVEYGGLGIGYGHIYDFYDENNKPDILAINWKNIVGVDAESAAAGGILWCGAAIFGGPVGVGGWITATCGGAAVGSLIQGAKEYVKHKNRKGGGAGGSW